MSIKTKLMQKNGLMAMTLAKELTTLDVGDRISTVARLAEKYDTARGTIQAALKFLQDYKAISLEPRGHLGTFISYIDYAKLLEIADINTLVGVMPLPYSKRYEGLATGLYNSSFAEKFSLNLAYMRGAKNRLKTLNEGRYDFAVMSRLAAEYYMSLGEPISIVMGFGNNSFVDNHVMVFNSNSGNKLMDGMKIGIDKSSLDHELLTLKQCEGYNVELVPLLYSQIMNKVIKGEIDGAICTFDELKDKYPELQYENLHNEYAHKNTEAVIVISEQRIEIKNLLTKFLSQDEVLNFQGLVLSNKMTPNY